MLLSDEALKNIETAIERRLNAILIFAGGRSNLTKEQIQDLVKAGIISKATKDEDLIEDAYLFARMQKEGEVPKNLAEFHALRDKYKKLLTTQELYSLKLAKQQIAAAIRRHKDVVRAVVTDLVLSGNSSYKNATGGVKEILENALLRREFVGRLATELRDKTADLYRDWRRVAITETTNAMNLGAADQIMAESGGKSPDKVYVYKSVVRDAALCDVCRRVYIESNGNYPKVYSMAELQANGTNVGKKKADWKAVIGSTHPHCRGKLLYLPNGWGFAKDSFTPQFFGKDFLWIRDKNKTK